MFLSGTPLPAPPLIQKIDSAIHCMDVTIDFVNAYPLDSNLSGG